MSQPRSLNVEKEKDSNLTDSTSVGWMEAENEGYYKEAKKKKIKMVKIDNFTFKGKVLPELGSWHYDRKRQILEKHPEIKNLFGTNPWSAVIYLIPFLGQLGIGYYLQVTDAPFWLLLLLSYTIGTVFAAELGIFGHEAAHGLVFSTPRWLNKLFACFAFTPVFFGPFANYWSVEHMYHHQVVVDKMNRYGPQQTNCFFKAIGCLMFPHVLTVLFFSTSLILSVYICCTIILRLLCLRKTFFPQKFNLPPYKNFPQIIGKWFIINQIITNSFFVALVYFIGPYALLYFYLSVTWANSLHPIGMRQVQEHYLRKKDQPTNSVYGFFQFLVLNVGYHTEHHDFPNVPWNRLPKIRAIAPEFYNNLFYYKSYNQVLYNFLFDKGIPTSVLLEGSIFEN